MFNLQKNMVRRVVINTVICCAVGIGLGKLSGVPILQDGNVLWLLAMSVGVSLFSGAGRE